MKVYQEYEAGEPEINELNGKPIYALKPTGKYAIYADYGELLCLSDEEHLHADLDRYTKSIETREKELQELYKKLREHYEKK